MQFDYEKMLHTFRVHCNYHRARDRLQIAVNAVNRQPRKRIPIRLNLKIVKVFVRLIFDLNLTMRRLFQVLSNFHRANSNHKKYYFP